ncbi:hypothetical protein ACFSR6_02930 [Pedobacter vanadiisoli]|uniref:Uncharacterized protein n=1 Tax=Pedobacter vanadiisoli TaxID=1761975 RepID=A0ABW5MFA5_9SPHI
MKRLSLILLMMLCYSLVKAQKNEVNFDVISYTMPEGWQRQENDGGLQLSVADKKSGAYAMVVITRASASTVSANENFNYNWDKLVKKTVQVNSAPAMSSPGNENGWEIISGGADYTSGRTSGTVTLMTATGGGKAVSVVLMTNTKQYQNDLTAFLNSLKLTTAISGLNSIATSSKSADIDFAGTWINRSSSNGLGTSGYIENEYIFNANGSYFFYAKIFNQSINNLILKKEKGTFEVSGKQLTLIPVSSVTEGWSRKNDIDEFGKLLSSQKNVLEKVSYQFTKHYFSGIQEWNLVLQASKPTKRDGPFSSNTTFNNAWYYAQPSVNKPAIKLP